MSKNLSHKAVRKLFNFSSGLVLCFFLAGCATRGFYYSKPVEDNKLYRFYPNGIVLFDLEGVDLFLSPQNHTSFDAGGIIPPVPIIIGKDSPEEFHHSDEYFEVEILLHAKKNGFRFNPKEVYLTLESGETLQPINYSIREGIAYFPLAKGPHSLLEHRSYHPSWNKEYQEGSEDKYFDLVKDKNMWGIGFVIRYATGTPRPGTLFSIEMKGLKYLDQKILIPKIQYKDKSRYNWTYFT